MASKFVVTFTYLLSFCARAMDSLSGDADLMSFVSSPELRPPIFNVTHHNRSRTTPGYWFVAPYADLVQRDPGKLAVPGQVGPHIYTDDGTLIWSGASLFPTRSICDFRQILYQGEYAISFIVTGRLSSATYPQGAAIIMDEAFSVVKEVFSPIHGTSINMHEFLVKDDGSSALLLYDMPVQWPELDDPYNRWGFVDSGFAVIDLRDGEARFMWNASDHISLSTSTKPEPDLGDRSIWDWIHLNAIDRDVNGDFLLTARHTDAVYKVSGKTGAILWQLGGTHSTFELQGFNSSRQHDARFVDANDTTTVLSILNNASDGIDMTADVSSAQLVRLDHRTSKASLMQNWDRPDGRLSHLRGNMQMLPDNNIFIGWSGTDGYMSEHSSDGEVLMEARFLSDRLSTYRAYKFCNFRGKPQHPPSVKAFVHQTAPLKALTVIYVSWNGATDVACWYFYTSQHNETASFTFSGMKDKTGFETVYSYVGLPRYVIVEAIAADGTPLRNSTVEVPIPQHGGCLGELTGNALKCLLDFEQQINTVSGAILSGPDSYPGSFDEWMPVAWLRGMACARFLSLVALGFCLSFIPKRLRRHRWLCSSMRDS